MATVVVWAPGHCTYIDTPAADTPMQVHHHTLLGHEMLLKCVARKAATLLSRVMLLSRAE